MSYLTECLNTILQNQDDDIVITRIFLDQDSVGIHTDWFQMLTYDSLEVLHSGNRTILQANAELRRNSDYAACRIVGSKLVEALDENDTVAFRTSEEFLIRWNFQSIPEGGQCWITHPSKKHFVL